MIKAFQKLFYVLCAFGGLGIIGMVSPAVTTNYAEFQLALRSTGLANVFYGFVVSFLIGICGIFFDCLHQIDHK